jgi:hypothetical protein
MNDTQDDSQDPLVRRAAQRYGTVGAMLAGGMVVFDKLLGRKPKQEAAVVFEASGDPIDIDNDGITIELDEHLTVHSPAPSKRIGSSRVVISFTICSEVACVGVNHPRSKACWVG